MGILPTDARRAAIAVYGAAIRDMSRRVVHSRQRADQTALRSWNTFTAWVGLQPHLPSITDPIPILQMFAHLVRHGILASSGNNIKKRSVEQYLRSVGQTFSSMGAKDPRLDDLGHTDFRLARQLKYYTKNDPPPTRVRPMPLGLLLLLFENFSTGSSKSQSIADLALIAFSSCYVLANIIVGGLTFKKSPFRLKDVQFGIGSQNITVHDLSIHNLSCLDTVSLTFTSQKNGIKGESITHGRTKHRWANPVERVLNRVLYLFHHKAPLSTPLCAILKITFGLK